MTGVVEETGGVAKAAVHALKGYPALLTLTILQVIMVIVLAFTVHQRNLSTDSVMKQLIDRCGPRSGADGDLPMPGGAI